MKTPFRLSVSLICFIVGFALHRLAAGWLSPLMPSRELEILSDRLSLLIVVGFLVLAARLNGQPALPFFRRPDWHSTVKARLPGRGSVGRPMPFGRFYAIAFVSCLAVMMVLVWLGGMAFSWPLLGFSLVFSIVNAMLEETIWRSQLLEQLRLILGQGWAVGLTSLGFGLQHLFLGFPIVVALAFALGGLFFALFTLQPRSIYPAIAFHVLINLGMVWSGFIL